MKQLVQLLLVIQVTCVAAVYGQLPKGVTVTKIWDKAPHSAFTDLIQYNGYFYCSFREGEAHVFGTDGTVRILRSKDGKDWESVADLRVPGIDLRDPKLSITPTGELMVIIGGSIYDGKTLKGRKPHVSFSSDGKKFSYPEQVTRAGETPWGSWIWRVTWYNGVGYAIDYQIGPEERRGPTEIMLVSTTDGKHYKKVSDLDIDGFANESTVRFDETGQMHVMVRRELEDQMGVMATSQSPYTDWTYQKMNYRLGGPNFLFDKSGNIIATTRVYTPEIYTGLLIADRNSAQFRELLHLPSGGDNSYAGMVFKGKNLWLSYYSQHEGNSAIYLVKVPVKLLSAQLRK